MEEDTKDYRDRFVALMRDAMADLNGREFAGLLLLVEAFTKESLGVWSKRSLAPARKFAEKIVAG